MRELIVKVREYGDRREEYERRFKEDDQVLALLAAREVVSYRFVVFVLVTVANWNVLMKVYKQFRSSFE